MSRTLTLLFASAFFFSTSLASAQPGDGKSEPKDALIVRVDAGKLPSDARQRLGKLAGFRYAGAFAFATMSSDGKLLAVSAANGNTFDMIEVATGKKLYTIQTQFFGGIQSGMAFSPDNSTFAIQSFQDLRIWDVASAKLLKQLPQRDAGGRSHPPSFSKDGKIVGAGSERFAAKNQTGEVKAYEVATGKVFGPFETVHNYNIRVAVAPDGKTMASWGQYIPRGGAMIGNEREAQRTLQIWDLAAGKELKKITLDFGPQGYGVIANAAFAPNGKSLIAVSGAATFHLIDAETGKETRRFSGQRGVGGLSGMRFSPDGEFFVTYDTGGTLQAWEIKSGKRLELDDGPKAQLLAVAFPGKKRIVALGNIAGSLHWWDATLTGKDSLFEGHLAAVSALTFSPDSKTVISAGADQTVLWWDSATGKEQRRLTLPDEDARYGGGSRSSFALAPNGKYAATSNTFGNSGLRVWNLKNGRVIYDLESLRSPYAIGIAFSPDGSRIAASGSQTPVHLWDITTGQELPKMPGNPNARNIGMNGARVAISPDGKIVAVHANNINQVGQQVAELILWDAGSAKELHRSNRQLPNIGINNVSGGMAFSTDGRYLALAENGGMIQLLSAATGREMRRFTSSNRSSGFQLAFSPDGRFLAVGSAPLNLGGIRNTPADEPIVVVWELASGQVRERFVGHTGGITCLAFSPDGTTLATGSSDTTVLLWDLTSRSGPKLPPLVESDVPAAWKSLATNDAKAGVTIRRMWQTPAPTLAYLKDHFKPVKSEEVNEKAIDKLVADLDGANFKTRDAAGKELKRLGERAEAALKKGLAGNATVEARRRIQEILDGMVRHDVTPAELQAIRGVEVLERIDTAEARALLTELSQGDPIVRATQDAAAALKRLEGK